MRRIHSVAQRAKATELSVVCGCVAGLAATVRQDDDSAPGTPHTQGIRYSRHTIATCDKRPPPSETTADASGASISASVDPEDEGVNPPHFLLS